MKTQSLVTVIVILFVIIGGGIFLSSRQTKSTDSRSQTMMKEDSAAASQDDSQLSADSLYRIYNKNILAEIKDKKRVLFFYANWCPTCQPADAAFKDNVNAIPENVVLIRVNYNDSDTDADEKALAQQYGVTYQHTFIQIDEDGNVVTKWNGGQLSELIRNIK